jgi:hypothetical protein
MLGRVRISGVTVLGSSAATGAFPLLDIVDMLRVIVCYGFIKARQVYFRPSSSSQDKIYTD